MLITILSLLLVWSVVGGAISLHDADQVRDLKPKWFWFVVYGPVLWSALAAIFAQISFIRLAEIIERKLRG